MYSCKNPLDVTNDFNKKLIDEKEYAIQIIHDSINFGMQHIGDTINTSFRISNNSKDSLVVFSITMPNKNYYILPFETIVLMPVNTDGYTVDIDLYFMPSEPGLFSDSIVVNNFDKPKLKLFSIIPVIFPKDINIGTVSVDDLIVTSKLEVVNTADYTIAIDTMWFTHPYFSFTNTSEYPIIVEADSSIIELINLETLSPTNINEKVYIRYNNSVIADTIAEIKAIIIN